MTETIMQVMAEVLDVPVGEITEDSSVETIGSWDSLRHMQLILALEDELNIEFPDDAIPNLVSFTVIAETVKTLRP